ncbi:NifU family protein [Patescibacteria group bacterium]|nr:NifU family protein [Patescibacteria group bacterium]MBU1028692.1 NifU family protein [Patescibacteria group bacterium]MBU1915697.1 NifU family protein [Patescibacteria group bacterium]
MIDINQALEKIRPGLQQDGGDVEVVSFEEKTGVLQVRFTGHCATCPFAQQTLKQGIEKTLKEMVPAVKSVELIK